MSDIKTYSSKSNAARAFRQQFKDTAGEMTANELMEAGHIDEDAPGKWVLNDPAIAAKADEDAAEQARADAEHARREEIAKQARAVAEQAERDAEANHPMTRVVSIGPAVGPRANEAPAPKPARAPSGTSNGLKIEADRPTQNGVTRPSIGGKCRGIWDMLDAIGKAATAKEAREAGEGKFDKTTIMVQFYRWRKFNGIEGRQ